MSEMIIWSSCESKIYMFIYGSGRKGGGTLQGMKDVVLRLAKQTLFTSSFDLKEKSKTLGNRLLQLCFVNIFQEWIYNYTTLNTI